MWLNGWEHRPATNPSPTQRPPRVPHAPPRGVLHTSEGAAGGYSNLLNGPYHGIILLKERRAIQVLDASLTCGALLNTGQVETNHMGRICLNLVIHDYNAVDMWKVPDDQLEWLGELLHGASVQCGIRPWLAPQPDFRDGELLASPHTRWRYTFSAWATCDHWICHVQVPTNDHWDIGPIDYRKVNSIMGLVDRVGALEAKLAQTNQAVFALAGELAEVSATVEAVSATDAAGHVRVKNRLNRQSERIAKLKADVEKLKP